MRIEARDGDKNTAANNSTGRSLIVHVTSLHTAIFDHLRDNSVAFLDKESFFVESVSKRTGSFAKGEAKYFEV